MGLRGPAPKPTVREITEGRPGHRPLPVAEPKPDVLFPRQAVRFCPANLRGEERWWWRYYFRQLCQVRVLTAGDLVALEKLAKATADRVAHEEALRKSGPLLRHTTRRKVGQDRKGKPIFEESIWPMISPLWTVVGQLREFELKLLREFGLTPAARTKVATVGYSKADAIEGALA